MAPILFTNRERANEHQQNNMSDNNHDDPEVNSQVISRKLADVYAFAEGCTNTTTNCNTKATYVYPRKLEF